MDPSNERIYFSYFNRSLPDVLKGLPVLKIPYNPRVLPSFSKVNRNGRLSGTFQRYQILDEKKNPVQSMLDHQGHIVPQNMLEPFLVKIADFMFQELDKHIPNTTNAVCKLANQYMSENFSIEDAGFENDLFSSALDLGTIRSQIGKMDDPSCLDDFFSLVEWNPLNICRAPSDSERLGIPGNQIDYRVLCFLKEAASDSDLSNYPLVKNKVPNQLQKFFKLIEGDCQQHPQALTDAQLASFVTILNTEIVKATSDEELSAGYYSFLWHNEATSGPANYQPYLS